MVSGREMAAWDKGWDCGSSAVGGFWWAVPGLPLGGLLVLVGYPVRLQRWHVLASVLIVRVHGPLWAYRGVWRPQYRGPLVWGQQVVLGHVVLVVRVCQPRVAP